MSPDPVVDPTPPAPPFALPPIVAYLVAAVIAIVGLFVGEGLISNHVEKLVAGLASIGIPLVFVLANAMQHLANARVKAARIHAGTFKTLSTDYTAEQHALAEASPVAGKPAHHTTRGEHT